MQRHRGAIDRHRHAVGEAQPRLRGALRRVPETRIFFEVIAPLLRPAIATVAVFTIVPIWKDLWFPLILTSSDSTHTVTLGVQQFLGQYITDWNSVLAALSMAILPVVAIYVIFSRQLISALTTGAVKYAGPWPDSTSRRLTRATAPRMC